MPWNARAYRLTNEPGGLGLSCTAAGLFLAGVPLLRKAETGFSARPAAEIGFLVKAAYGEDTDPTWLLPSIDVVARALNRGELARAMIAAVLARVPELSWDAAARLAKCDRSLGKSNFNTAEPRNWHGRWTSGNAVPPASEATPARPAGQPRLSPPDGGWWPAPAGTSSNPWFQPVGAEEDENGRGGLLGDFMDLPREFRLEMYGDLRARLRDVDPRNPALESLTGPDYSPSQADVDALGTALREAQARAGEPPATAWELGWGARGVALERLRLAGPRTLPSNTPTIDDFPYGVALSIKSIDLNAPWYRDPLNLSRRIDRYVDRLRAFNVLKWGNVRIEKGDVEGKVLDIVVPTNSGTPAQQRAIAAAIERARSVGVHVFLSGY